MPSILTDDEKQTVKRTVPKASNKIHAVAVARLYIAYPNRTRWTYTGLHGAAVLANDLVGNTFWIKLVDLSASNRGVIWDQEIYDTWSYNQDRIFFHTFEGEECLYGLSFSDEKEAKQFLKKMGEREKNAHKNTRSKPFASGPAQTGYGGAQPMTVGGGGGGGGGKSHGRFGGLFSSHRSSSNSQAQGPPQSIIPPRGVEINSHVSSPAQHSPGVSRPTSASGIDFADPATQAVIQDLLQMGITEDQIEEHAAFIKSYLEQNKATAAAEAEKKERAARAPPPPPPAPANLSPQNTGSSTGAGRRGPPPAPPPSRRGGSTAVVQRAPSPSPSPPREPSPPRPRFRAPPPIADAGKFANDGKPGLPSRGRAVSQSTPGPPPPPRPPKTPLDDERPSMQPSSRFAVPPPFEGRRVTSGPPPPPARNSGGMPPPPPPRDQGHSVSAIPPPPPPRGGFSDTAPPPPPLPPPNARPVPPAPGGFGGPPPPPPLPPPNASSGPPPPPPLPPSAGGGPPPPPPMPPRGGGATTGVGSDTAPALPNVDVPGRGGLLADIQKGARLKKVSDQEKRDRSAAMVPGTEAAAPAPPSAGGSGGGGGDAAQGGLAGALASALAARKSKVSHSDDERDDDDW